MKSTKRVALFLLLLPTLLAAQAKKKHTVPAAFSNARYAWVETIDERDAFSPGIFPDDRQAIVDVEDALRDWNRYSITTSRSQAELVFVVRKGRLASATLGGTVGVGTAQPYPGQRPTAGTGGTSRGASVGTEAGAPDDLLEVHLLNSDGTLGAQLWTRSFEDGLQAPQVALIAQLKKAVEHDYPMNPPPPPSKP
jgi:hypothetical protein